LAIEEDDEEEDYFVDDKFVYEDIPEDHSSDDPENKFLKEHAERTARESEAPKSNEREY